MKLGDCSVKLVKVLSMQIKQVSSYRINMEKSSSLPRNVGKH
jgi:hypothetical protein